MSDIDSVTEWLDRLKAGDDSGAAGNLWSRYIGQLIRVANRKLASRILRSADEEDVVVQAFQAFLAGVQDGRFHKLSDRSDLWQILVMLVDRKTVDEIRRHETKKGGAGWVRSDIPIDAFLDSQPSPEFAAEAVDQLERLLRMLDEQDGDGLLRQISILKMDAHTNQEIASQLSKSVASIERKLRLIRRIWSEDSVDVG